MPTAKALDAPKDGHDNARLDFEGSADSIILRLSGSWMLAFPLPSANLLQDEINRKPSVRCITFDAQDLQGWDTGLLTFLMDVITICSQRQIEVINDGLPSGIQRLLALATAVPENKSDRTDQAGAGVLARLYGFLLGFWRSALETLAFLGSVAIAFFRMCTGRARFRGSDLLRLIQHCGAEAVPIVCLISILVGLILAFVGSIQLKMFGAQKYIADLVGISMVRAMGAIMTGIIMAGRTGASFAAQIGTMQVNEEIDALRTAGIPPVEFLVLPRILALALMMPLLTLYADLMGILGGLIVSVAGFDINFIEYYNETRIAVNLTNVGIGLFSGFVFGILIGLAGCLRGMQCGRSASAVGDMTTSAVVTSIVSIIIATAVITVLCDVLRI
jgi:phospholipid/cholesterol/gamma-HCH transport system permease protein